MLGSSVDPHAPSASVLMRLTHQCTVHRSRLVQAISNGAASAAAHGADGRGRPAAVSHHNAEPANAAELRELCDYFDLFEDSDTAGGHAVLREARRVCDHFGAQKPILTEFRCNLALVLIGIRAK